MASRGQRESTPEHKCSHSSKLGRGGSAENVSVEPCLKKSTGLWSSSLSLRLNWCEPKDKNRSTCDVNQRIPAEKHRGKPKIRKNKRAKKRVLPTLENTFRQYRYATTTLGRGRRPNSKEYQRRLGCLVGIFFFREVTDYLLKKSYIDAKSCT